MRFRRILGVDPGLQHTGWGIIESDGHQLVYVACGTIHTNQAMSVSSRLCELHDTLDKVIAHYKPESAAIEETFVNRNAVSSLKLGYARGALLLTLAAAGLDPEEYASTKVKKSVVGAGKAAKEQVSHMVKVLLPSAEPDSADAADALAVAICHAHHDKIRVQSTEFS